MYRKLCPGCPGLQARHLIKLSGQQKVQLLLCWHISMHGEEIMLMPHLPLILLFLKADIRMCPVPTTQQFLKVKAPKEFLKFLKTKPPKGMEQAVLVQEHPKHL